MLGVTDVGASFPHTVTYHPTCHSLRLLGVGDRPLRLLEAVRGITLVDLPAADQCCGFGGTFAVKNADTSIADGIGQGTPRARDRRGGARRGRQLLPDAHRRTDEPSAGRRTTDAPGRGPGCDGGRRMTALRSRHLRRDAAPSRRRHAPPSRTRSCGTTSPTRPPRSATSGPGWSRRCEDWEDLRLAGAAIKDATLADLEQHLLQPRGRADEGRRRRCTGPATLRRPTGSSPADREAPPGRRGRQGQVDGHPGDRSQRSAGRGGHRRVGDRPRRADRAARRRPAQPHPGARHPPQPRRDPADLPRADGSRREACSGRPHRRPRGAGRRRPAAPA